MSGTKTSLSVAAAFVGVGVVAVGVIVFWLAFDGFDPFLALDSLKVNDAADADVSSVDEDSSDASQGKASMSTSTSPSLTGRSVVTLLLSSDNETLSLKKVLNVKLTLERQNVKDPRF